MCGICGQIELTNPGNLSERGIRSMIRILNHRGPDESGYYKNEKAILGHARLSIIDLQGGTQPMCNEDGSLWISFNGEIFNYVEIRQELTKKGHTFRTKSDTEVILHLFEEKGEKLLEDLNGQFAFAIWDNKKNRLFLARDRVGIRPLYYWQQNESLLFASEIKALFVDKRVPNNLTIKY